MCVLLLLLLLAIVERIEGRKKYEGSEKNREGEKEGEKEGYCIEKVLNSCDICQRDTLFSPSLSLRKYVLSLMREREREREKEKEKERKRRKRKSKCEKSELSLASNFFFLPTTIKTCLEVKQKATKNVFQERERER